MLGNKLSFLESKRMIVVLMLAVTSLFMIESTYAGSGEDLFKQNCAACHKLSSQPTTGPGLAGVTEKRSKEWLGMWIKNSGELVASGDADAVAIFEEYNKAVMPTYGHFPDGDIDAIISFLEENDAQVAAGGGAATSSSDSGGDDEGVFDSVSSLTIMIFLVLIVLAILYFVRLNKKVDNLMLETGFFMGPHSTPNFWRILIGCIAVGGLIIALLSYWLKHDSGQVDGLFFGVFPYLTIGIFLVGSIYRYTKKGYQVSSLSSQFLEGKKLFRGSQPFHWGLLVLFFGHLIAFLFPSALLLWNGEPVRLMILEVSSFAFAILALWGLINLIHRRLTNKTLLVVSNKMDMVVYTVLLTQIVSGLGVAFFVRWGSSWFASVLTPYLRSVFSFNPDLAAISDAPILVQIHVISAFLIIGLIPFTRFMHFLVAPVDYIFRKYQLVIWNWNRKSIRRSGRHTFGKKSRNH